MPAACPQEYFRRSVFVPFLDNILQELTDRYIGHGRAVCHLIAAVPSHIVDYTFADFSPAMDVYAKFVASEVEVRAEFELWQQRWRTVPTHDDRTRHLTHS